MLSRLLSLSAAIAVYGLAAGPPEAIISNSQIRAKIYLPDAASGFYQGTRFDWSGIVGEVDAGGHHYYGPWFNSVDPAVRDVSYKDDQIIVGVPTSAVGPAEEFQTPLAYETAKAGDTFIKIGVGILKRGEDTRYAFSNLYEIVDHGRWSKKVSGKSVEVTQELSDPASGYAYVYTKTIRVADGQPQLIIEHRLKNTGKLSIKSLLYDHNFTVFDHLPTGDIVVNVPYEIKSTRPPDATFARIDGKELAYVKVLQDQERVAAGLQGFGSDASDYDFRIENQKAGAGIRIQGDRPLQNASLWSIRSVVAVEPFIQIAAEPGQEFTWKYIYTYYALSK
jgi:hypothetical protein